MARIPLNTCVDFLGDFPVSSDELPGKEVAQFLAAGLAERGIEVLRIEKRRPDIGYCVGGLSRGRQFRVCVTVRPWSELARWQLATSAATRRGPRSLRGRADLDALEYLLRNLDDAIRHAQAIWDIRWFSQADESDCLDIQRPGTGPFRDSESDTDSPFLIRARRFLRLYTVLLLVAYYLVFAGLTEFGGANDAYISLPALTAFGTVLLYGVVIPRCLAIPISEMAQRHRAQRKAALARRPRYPWPRPVDQSGSGKRFQFDLRTMLGTMTAASALLSVGCWIGWGRILGLAQFCLFVAHIGATGAPLILMAPWIPTPNKKVVGTWACCLGALFVLHVLATSLVIERLLQIPLLFDIIPYDRFMLATLNWTVPYVAVGLLIATLFWQQARSSRTCMAGCCLAALGLAAAIGYGHRLFCHYFGYDLPELSERVWWVG